MRDFFSLGIVQTPFNHSCCPNLGLRKISELFALKNIKKGDELTYDYSSSIAPTEWKMVCKCGEVNCRKIIGDITSIPKKQLQYYKRRGALQKHILQILHDVESGQYKMPWYERAALKALKKTSED